MARKVNQETIEAPIHHAIISKGAVTERTADAGRGLPQRRPGRLGSPGARPQEMR